MSDHPDTVLLRRYLDDGDEVAFAELVQRHLGLVYHAALRQAGGQANAAEDIAQAVFTLLARKAASLVRHETLAGWLHTTTRYTAHFHRRRESRRIRREEAARLMQEDHATETGPSDWERLRPLIDEVLAELTAADRDAILLRFFTGLPFAEVGAKLKVSENAARMRVDRALEKLHARLARRGVASTAVALGGALTAQAMASVPAGLAVSITSAVLSSAAAGGAGAAVMAAGLFCMNAKTVILTAALLLAVSFAFFQFNKAQERETLLIEANRDRDALRERLHNTASLSEKAPSKAVAAAVPGFEPDGNGNLRAVVATPSDRPPEPPRVAKIRATANRRIQSLDAQYRPLYRVLGLDAARGERFKKILIENARRNEELMTAAEMRRANGELAASQQAIDEQTNAELAAAIRAEFGEAAVQAMSDHERTLPFRAPLEEFAKTLFYTDTPLTASQAEQLLAAVVRHERDTRGTVDFDWMVQPDLYGAMLTQSSGILSEPQIEALRGITELELKTASVKKPVKK